MIQFRFPESNGQRSAEADAYFQTGRSAFVNGGIDAYLSWLLEHNATDASSDYGYAINRLRLGDTEGSLEHLQKAVKNRAFMVAFLIADTVFDPVRNDPRYRDIVRNIGSVVNDQLAQKGLDSDHPVAFRSQYSNQGVQPIIELVGPLGIGSDVNQKDESVEAVL